MTKIFFILFILFSSQLFADNEFVGKKFLCKKLLWGFDFFSAEKVNVISTNINNKTNVEEYYYEIGIQLPYINLYLNKENKKDTTFSIHREEFRIDIWTMTSGGNTTRTFIPSGFCEEVKVSNIVNYIDDLKDNKIKEVKKD